MRLLLLLIALVTPFVSGAQAEDVPRVEPGDCIYKADGALKTTCGYLVVPENRHNPQGRVIKLPFIYVESNNPAKKPDPVLYTGGAQVSVRCIRSLPFPAGPCCVTGTTSHSSSVEHTLQCPTWNAKAQASGSAAYLGHRSTEDAVQESVRQCREKLVRQGIDLSAYNTDESAADIEDLRRLLKIDSLNLMGISYSGGLMMAVLQKYPQHIRSLILDSPLPEFVNIDEQELANFNEALTAVLDSGDSSLLTRFHNYFSGLGGKVLRSAIS